MRPGAASTVAEALQQARTAGVERLDAHALLSAVLAKPRAWLFAHEDAALDAGAASRYATLLSRRAGGEPLAYLIGEKEFFGLCLRVSADVLVPRPDTETLVEWALDRLPADAPASLADLGTGSGAIALAIASRRPQVHVVAVDASPAALAVAADNGRRLGLTVEWLPSDWFSALAGRRFEVIASNPPYVAAGDPHLAALTHEPLPALVSGREGLDAIRRIAAEALAYLQPGGWLLLEHGHDQSDAVAALLAGAGLREVSTRRDLAGHPRCTGGRWPG